MLDTCRAPASPCAGDARDPLQASPRFCSSPRDFSKYACCCPMGLLAPLATAERDAIRGARRVTMRREEGRRRHRFSGRDCDLSLACASTHVMLSASPRIASISASLALVLQAGGVRCAIEGRRFAVLSYGLRIGMLINAFSLRYVRLSKRTRMISALLRALYM